MKRKWVKVIHNKRFGGQVTLDWSWPFVHLVRFSIWGCYGRGGWMRTR